MGIIQLIEIWCVEQRHIIELHLVILPNCLAYFCQVSFFIMCDQRSIEYLIVNQLLLELFNLHRGTNLVSYLKVLKGIVL